MLKSDKAPYFLTLLFAALGWTITHVTDNILSARAIKYDINYSSKNPNVPFNFKEPLCAMEIELTNLTTDTFFKELEFRFEIQNSDSTELIRVKDVIAHQPLNFVSSQLEIVRTKNTTVVIEGLHPQTSATISIFFQGKTKPSFLLDVSDTGRNVDQPLLLMQSGLKTLIIENETLLFLALILIWLITISFYVIKIK